MVLVLLVVLTVKSHTLKQKNSVYQEEIAQLQKQMDEETARTQEIKDLEAYMQTDEYAEQVAKDKLGWYTKMRLFSNQKKSKDKQEDSMNV